MTYFKINNNDYSMYVSALKVGTEHKYKSRTNASGNLMVKYVNTKRVIEVGIIPLDAAVMASLQDDINKFQVSISFLNPETRALETISCIIPQQSVDYYTVQAGNVKFQAFALTFTEL